MIIGEESFINIIIWVLIFQIENWKLEFQIVVNKFEIVVNFNGLFSVAHNA